MQLRSLGLMFEVGLQSRRFWQLLLPLDSGSRSFREWCWASGSSVGLGSSGARSYGYAGEEGHLGFSSVPCSWNRDIFGLRRTHDSPTPCEQKVRLCVFGGI